MNNDYLAFWTNAISNVFTPEKNTMVMHDMIDTFFSHMEESNPFISMFNADSQEEARTYYNQAIAPYMALWGMVSIDEYRKLLARYEKLKKEEQARKKTTTQKDQKLDKKIVSNKEKSAEQEAQLTAQTDKIEKLKMELAKERKSIVALKKEITNQKRAITLLKKNASSPAKPKKIDTTSKTKPQGGSK